MYRIIITTSFPGFHLWKDATDHFAYLKNIHRHVFHVRAEMEVTHANRDIEFIDLKELVDDYITAHFRNEEFEYSCEQIAKMLADGFGFDYVEVLEDNENGGSFTKKRDCKCSNES